MYLSNIKQVLNEYFFNKWMNEWVNFILNMNEFRPFPRGLKWLISVLGARDSAVKTNLHSFLHTAYSYGTTFSLNRDLIVLKIEFHIERSLFFFFLREAIFQITDYWTHKRAFKTFGMIWSINKFQGTK